MTESKEPHLRNLAYAWSLLNVFSLMFSYISSREDSSMSVIVISAVGQS